MPLDHYVSQVHLRNFYSPSLGSRMYAMRKRDLKSFTPDSQSVCRIEEGNTNAFLKNDRMIEEFLKKIEPNYNSALAKLTEGRIDPECIFTIAGFAAYVFACSPTAARIFTTPLEDMAKNFVADAEKSGALPRLPDELGGYSLTELLRTQKVKLTVDPKYPQAIGIASILEHVAAFGNFNWDVPVNRFDQSPFFTSDFPVTIEKTDDWSILNKIVPLAPHLAVRFKPNPRIDRKRSDFTFANFDYRMREIGHTELVDINRLIVRSAEELVFYRDDAAWVPKFIAKNRRYRIASSWHKGVTHDGRPAPILKLKLAELE
jgi:hypothetical protein